LVIQKLPVLLLNAPLSNIHPIRIEPASCQLWAIKATKDLAAADAPPSEKGDAEKALE
jgi:hypothetical protein